MPLKWNSKILLAKIEGTYGTDPTPTGADNAVLAQQVTLSPMEGEDAARNLERPWLSSDQTIPVNLRARLQFRTELAGSGAAGTAPAWGPLLRACGCAQVIDSGVSVTYNPITDSHESVTFWFYIEGTRYVMNGCRGNARVVIGAQAIPYLEWDFTGLFSAPSAQSRPSPTLSGWQAPLPATNANTPTFTINDVSMVLREFNFNLGNQVEPRLLINSDSIIIPARAESIAARVEAVALATLNPYTLAAAGTLVEVEIVHGTGAGNIVTLTAPKCQLQRPNELANQQNQVEWPLNFVPQPTSGNDQWSLALT